MKRVFSLFLSLLVFCCAMIPYATNSEEEENRISYYAVATTTLKIRREPNIDSFGCGSIAKNSVVNIIECGETWSKIKQENVIGWIQTKYLKDITEVGASPLNTQEEKAEPQLNPDVDFLTTQDSYIPLYQASTVSASVMYQQPDLSSNRVCNISIYKDLTVGEISGDWSYCCYDERYYGYVLTDNLFKWDRLDAYAGDIPGLDVWPSLAFVNSTTDLFDYETGESLKTINPGAAIAVSEEADGRYKVAFYRQYGYILSGHIANTINTVPYEQAKSGDLLSVMTTYYPVGISTLQQQGRNWNIRLSSTFVTGTVLQPGQTFDMNACIAPYLESTGYKSAPIMSPNALSGYGGGTCQVNTTFYNATIALPLLITHRRVHADVGIYYCKKGFDAAVGGGSINLTMQNTLPYAIRYQMFISDGVLTCCIFKN